tara:strand:- start:328 stop:495 length:168 start_codon:yes stop_codon:yes gene_type:complete
MKWLMREKFNVVDVVLLIWISRAISDGNYVVAAVTFCFFTIIVFISRRNQAARGE